MCANALPQRKHIRKTDIHKKTFLSLRFLFRFSLLLGGLGFQCLSQPPAPRHHLIPRGTRAKPPGPAPRLRSCPPRDLVPAAWAAPQPLLPPSPGEGPKRQGLWGPGWRGGLRLGARPGVRASPPRSFSSAATSPPVPHLVLSVHFSPGHWSGCA